MVALYNAIIDAVGVLADRLEALLRWILAYPIYPLQLLLILLVATGSLGREVGAEQLFWKHEFMDQFGVGLFVSLLLCTTLYVEYVLNRPTWLMRRLPGPSLLPSLNPEVRALGRYLFWGLAAGLFVLYFFKGVAIYRLEPESTRASYSTHFWSDARREYLENRNYLYPFAVGYGFAIVFIELLFIVDELPFWVARKNQIREWLLNQRLVLDRHLHLSTPRELLVVELTRRAQTTEERFTPAVLSLHGIGVYMMIVALVILFGFLAAIAYFDANRPGECVGTPVALVCSILALLTLIYGVITYFVHTQRLIMAAAFLALVCWNSSSIDSANDYKLRFPGLTYDQHTMLWDQTKASERGKRNTEDLYGEILAKTERYANDCLIPSELPLQAMSARWQESNHGKKPKVIFICASGGGIRAAVWTGVVLGKLEKGGLRDNIRMITGASGGMVGAALYAADFENGPLEDETDPDGTTNRLVRVLAQDSLSRTAQSLVLRDMVRNVFVPPWSSCEWDRGRTLEWRWGLIAQQNLSGRNPFARTFRSLRGDRPDEKALATTGGGEWAGKVPSVVFSPMLIEDSRRLLISNLDLCGRPPYQQSVAHSFGPNCEDQLQVSAVEFHRLFPDLPRGEFEALYGEWSGGTSENFTIGTASRMNATFPIISPAVSLPTVPPRRVVDAGYYDNYGMNLAALWIWKHRALIREQTSGFAIVEIRAFPLEDTGHRFAATDPQTGKPDSKPSSGDLITDSAAAISAPLEAVLNARSNVQKYRNAEIVEILSREFADCNQPGTPFFYNVWFELDRPASLNWYLSDQERKNVQGGFGEKYQSELDRLARWYWK